MIQQDLFIRRRQTLGPTYQNFFDEPLHLVRGAGTRLWDVDADTREPWSREQMRHLGSLILEQGVITGYSGRYGQILKLRPPLPFSASNADKTVAAIDDALNRLKP
ncbi:MAG: hypothetical protein JSU67_13355 [Gammaproteobacteria bacterium]|nr:MAG: hypothetical protein EP300_14915 [Gammaproteobacteria bacterium]UCH39140.1 MAG: hypothetical protein JSU67_13355 [Gammaproteobacteria bacterium]